MDLQAWLLVGCVIVGGLLAVLSDKIWTIPEAVDSVVHELSHTLAGLVWGGSLPRRIVYHGTTEAEVHSVDLDLPLSRSFITLSGYTGVILIGIGLLVTAPAEGIVLTPMFFAAIVLFAIMSLLPVWLNFTAVLRLFATLAFWVVLLLAFVMPDETFGGHTETITGAQFCLGYLLMLVLIMSWGNIFNAFTFWRKEALISIAITSSMLIGFLLLWNAAPAVQLPVLMVLGGLLLTSGIKTLFISHGHHGGDFRIMAEESRFITSERAWWWITVLVMLPFQLACLAVFLLSFVWV